MSMMKISAFCFLVPFQMAAHPREQTRYTNFHLPSDPFPVSLLSAVHAAPFSAGLTAAAAVTEMTVFYLSYSPSDHPAGIQKNKGCQDHSQHHTKNFHNFLLLRPNGHRGIPLRGFLLSWPSLFI